LVDLGEERRRLAEHAGEILGQLGDEVREEPPQAAEDEDVEDEDRGGPWKRARAHANAAGARDQRRQDVRHQDREQKWEDGLPENVDDEDTEQREAPQLRELSKPREGA